MERLRHTWFLSLLARIPGVRGFASAVALSPESLSYETPDEQRDARFSRARDPFEITEPTAPWLVPQPLRETAQERFVSRLDGPMFIGCFGQGDTISGIGPEDLTLHPYVPSAFLERGGSRFDTAGAVPEHAW